MSPLGQPDPFPFTRRSFLKSVGVGSLAIGAVPLLETSPAVAPTNATKTGSARIGPTLLRQPTIMGTPNPEQVHVQFGADAATEAAVSWAVSEKVQRPQLRLGLPDTGAGAGAGAGLGLTVDAQEKVYTEALTGQTVYTYHAKLPKLVPDTSYSYQVFHAGSQPVNGGFTTGPLARSKAFGFTSFGDQSVPSAVGMGLGPWSPNAGYIVPAIEAAAPLFHLMNGDLCYGNVSDDPVATWSSFFNNNMGSAAFRPWMPCAGNHENEVGNGPQGYLSYQTRFTLPDNDERPEWQGNWYSFVVGNLFVISLNNDDVCLQDGAFSGYRAAHVPDYAAHGDNPYIIGYSGGAQRRWLEATLKKAQRTPGVDWIIVVMHQVAMSSAHFNGADLGIRQQWLPLFDQYGVDLVVAGHEHHFERTFAVRGTLPEEPDLLTPAPQGDDPTVIDTSEGFVHMIIGGGGNPGFTPLEKFDVPHDGVLIVGVNPGSPEVQHSTITTTEQAPWSAYRDITTPYGFATFDVEPNAGNNTTSIVVTHYGAAAGSSVYAPVDSFTLTRPHR
jgi:hypothetical protein